MKKTYLKIIFENFSLPDNNVWCGKPNSNRHQIICLWFVLFLLVSGNISSHPDNNYDQLQCRP